MKTAALTLPETRNRSAVKKHLIRGIVFLTSEKFLTFALTTGSAIAWLGVCAEQNLILAFGVLIFLLGFSPWGLRITAREVRQQRRGVKTISMTSANPINKTIK